MRPFYVWLLIIAVILFALFGCGAQARPLDRGGSIVAYLMEG